MSRSHYLKERQDLDQRKGERRAFQTGGNTFDKAYRGRKVWETISKSYLALANGFM